MAAADVELVRGAWATFARGDLVDVEAVLHSDVRWYGADDPGSNGACRSRRDALAFIQRARADGVSAELLDAFDAGERVVAVIRTNVPPDWEQPADRHGEVITVRDGKIAEMVVYPSVEEAFAAAGVPTAAG